MEGNDGVIWNTLGKCRLDHVEKSIFLLLAVDNHFSSKEPVAMRMMGEVTYVSVFCVVDNRVHCNRYISTEKWVRKSPYRECSELD